MINQPRPAAVAGMFYPASAAVLTHDVEQLLAAAEAPPTNGKCPKAIVVPHAGYVYSGPIAASAYSTLRAFPTISRIVLLGPTHRVAVHGVAVPACDAFVTPLGPVPIDRQALAAIADWPHVVVSDEVHAEEHSLEVQLPFLQTLLGEFSLVPLAVGKADVHLVADIIECLWGGDETLIVVSTDLSHYLPHAAAEQVDGQTAQRILELDPTLGHFQACGAAPLNGLLLAARKRGLQPQLLDLRNSGDTAGDKSRVVGYAAFAFYDDE